MASSDGAKTLTSSLSSSSAAPVSFYIDEVWNGPNRIIFRCAASNGLFGLGIKNMSVPSMLASSGLTANSFSMCFSSDGAGRVNFGGKGSSYKGETPLNLDTPHMTQAVIGKNIANVDFTAIFDMGTSFTYLNDPAYSIITKGFTAQAEETRSQPNTTFLSTIATTLGQMGSSLKS